MLTFSDSVSKTFNWLNGERAATIAAICKKHGATCKRLAQKRGTLGVCKVVATWREHSWYASSQAWAGAKAELEAAGLFDSLTFQD